ncbi:hypothetical protein V8E53_004572 [Lactarius tabidus]
MRTLPSVRCTPHTLAFARRGCVLLRSPSPSPPGLRVTPCTLPHPPRLRRFRPRTPSPVRVAPNRPHPPSPGCTGLASLARHPLTCSGLRAAGVAHPAPLTYVGVALVPLVHPRSTGHLNLPLLPRSPPPPGAPPPHPSPIVANPLLKGIRATAPHPPSAGPPTTSRMPGAKEGGTTREDGERGYSPARVKGAGWATPAARNPEQISTVTSSCPQRSEIFPGYQHTSYHPAHDPPSRLSIFPPAPVRFIGFHTHALPPAQAICLVGITVAPCFAALLTTPALRSYPPAHSAFFELALRSMTPPASNLGPIIDALPYAFVDYFLRART